MGAIIRSCLGLLILIGSNLETKLVKFNVELVYDGRCAPSAPAANINKIQTTTGLIQCRSPLPRSLGIAFSDFLWRLDSPLSFFSSTAQYPLGNTK